MKLAEIIPWSVAAILAVGLAVAGLAITGVHWSLFGVNIVKLDGYSSQLKTATGQIGKLSGDLAASEQAKALCLAANTQLASDLKASQSSGGDLLTTERAACDARVARIKRALQNIEKVTHEDPSPPDGASSVIAADQLRVIAGQAPD